MLPVPCSVLNSGTWGGSTACWSGRGAAGAEGRPALGAVLATSLAKHVEGGRNGAAYLHFNHDGAHGTSRVAAVAWLPAGRIAAAHQSGLINVYQKVPPPHSCALPPHTPCPSSPNTHTSTRPAGRCNSWGGSGSRAAVGRAPLQQAMPLGAFVTLLSAGGPHVSDGPRAVQRHLACRKPSRRALNSSPRVRGPGGTLTFAACNGSGRSQLPRQINAGRVAAAHGAAAFTGQHAATYGPRFQVRLT